MNIKIEVSKVLGAIGTNLEKGLSLFTEKEIEAIKKNLQVTILLLVITAGFAVAAIWSTTAAGLAILVGLYALYWVAYTLRRFILAQWRVAKSLMPKRPFWTRSEREDVVLFAASSVLFAIFWYVGKEWSLRYGTETTMAYAVFAGWVAVVCAGLLFLSMLVFSVRGVRRWKKSARENLLQ